MNLSRLLLFVSVFLSFISQAQVATQTIKGQVLDIESNYPIEGASVVLFLNDSLISGTVADVDGYYKIDNVSIGKYNLKVYMLGYEHMSIPNVILDAGKETVLDVKLQEEIAEMEEVVIDKSQKDKSSNEHALISARTFNVEETNRYAGSRADPMRMASNYAGVQGSDDTRNDVVIRGNSPNGLLFRLEGADVPNPNHFAIPGTNGGPVSMLNNKSIGKGDFFTGAFPAEFGNGIAGAFDLRLRNGNYDHHELSGQFGFLGTELAAEGPFKKGKKSSYLGTFRYSTLQLFSMMGISIGTSALPKYWDYSYKLNFPLKNNANLAIFGLGGDSSIDIIVSDKDKDNIEKFGRRDRDQHFGTSLNIAGLSFSKAVNADTYYKVILSGSYSNAGSLHELVVRDNDFNVIDMYDKLKYSFKDYKTGVNAFVNKKINKKVTVKFGARYYENFYNMYDQDGDSAGNFVYRINFENHTGTAMGYSQLKYRPIDKITFSGGLNVQYFVLNESIAIEPRFNAKWQINNKNDLVFGYGKHSQTQPAYIYFQTQLDDNNQLTEHNIDLAFSKSDHYVLGYNLSINKSTRLKFEGYYQWLYNIPVDVNPSSFSMINFGTSYRMIYPDKLKNDGTGKNYGVEMTFERFFNKSFFFLATGSLFESKYKGSDGIERSTAFNGNFATNFLFGKEWKVAKSNTLTVGVKATWAGGRRYTPVDIDASVLANELIEDDSKAFEAQFDDYMRADVKIGYKINGKKVTHEIGLDLVNVLNNKNPLRLTFIPPAGDDPAEVIEETQLAFLPLFYYRIDFRVK